MFVVTTANDVIVVKLGLDVQVYIISVCFVSVLSTVVTVYPVTISRSVGPKAVRPLPCGFAV